MHSPLPFDPPPKLPFCTVERLDNGYIVAYLDVQLPESIEPKKYHEPAKDDTEEMKRAIEAEVVKEINCPVVVRRRVFCKTPKEVCDYADRACAAYEEACLVGCREVIF